jgi:hypothetical protein
LPGLIPELQADNLPIKFSASIIDRVLHARLSSETNEDPSSQPLFDYLVGSWKRTVEARKRVNQVMDKAPAVPEDAKIGLKEKVAKRLEILNAIRELAVSYSGLVIMPGMAESFPQRAE